MDREGRGRSRSIGRYVLYDRIASGGMAQVHLGRLVGAVGFSRTVAIKRLLPHCATDAEIVPMFVDEARLAARIRHPNVVGTLDVVQEGDELLLVMEYVHGESLARLVRSAHSRAQLVPPSIVVAIGISVLEGLHAAHEARSERGEPLGIIHRDVSPQNIIIGADGVARVVDFGIAKARGRIQTTRDGQLKGKAGYIAPEQIQSETHELDRRVDVYAASVVLWEALVGRRLFQGDGAPAVMRKVLEERVEPPSRFASGVPRKLDDVIMRGLSRIVDDRFTTAREMAVALERVLAPATAREIEQWVHSLAADVLADRAALVAAIENDSAQAFTGGNDRVYAATSLVVRDRREEGKPSDDIATTPLSVTPSGSVAIPVPLEASPSSSPSSMSRGRGVWIASGVLAVAAVLGFLLFTRQSSSFSSSSPSSLEPSDTTHARSIESAEPPFAASTSSTSSTSSTASSAPAPLPAVSTIAPEQAKPPSSRQAHPPSRPPPSPNVAPRAEGRQVREKPPGCAVPFTRAADGTKIPKPECF